MEEDLEGVMVEEARAVETVGEVTEGVEKVVVEKVVVETVGVTVAVVFCFCVFPDLFLPVAMRRPDCIAKIEA